MIDNFTDLRLNKKNIDIYIARKGVLDAINCNLNTFSGQLLDFGCGKMPYKKYILKNSSIETYVGLDIEGALIYDKEIKPDYVWNGITMPFEDNIFNTAFGTEVLEHCPNPDIILNEINRVLKPGGVLFFTVPFIWNLHETPHDEYRYTPFSLKRHLENNGFDNISIQPTGGWHASLAQMLGLWCSRGIGKGIKYKVFSPFILLFVRILLKFDKKPLEFKNGVMMPGLFGIAYKKIVV